LRKISKRSVCSACRTRKTGAIQIVNKFNNLNINHGKWIEFRKAIEAAKAGKEWQEQDGTEQE
jgi:hypothetical protein